MKGLFALLILNLIGAQAICVTNSDCAMNMEETLCCFNPDAMQYLLCVDAMTHAQDCVIMDGGMGSPPTSSMGMGSPPTSSMGMGSPPTSSMGMGSPPTSSMGMGSPPTSSMGMGSPPTSSMGSPPTPPPTRPPTRPPTNAPPTSPRSCTNKCNFDGFDSSFCNVYGSLDGALISWDLASQNCLDAFMIKDEAIDPQLLRSMFPTSDGKNGNVNSFVNYLRFTEDSVTYGFRASFALFFQDTGMGGRVEMRPSVTYDMTTEDCSMSESPCWTLFKEYLNTDSAGHRGMETIGATLYAKQAQSRELEQSIVRIRLCNIARGVEMDGALEADTFCYSLYTQVKNVERSNPSKDCSAFGLGPGSLCGSTMGESPTYSPNSNSNPDDNVNPETGITSAAAVIAVIAIVVIVVGLIYWKKHHSQ